MPNLRDLFLEAVGQGARPAWLAVDALDARLETLSRALTTRLPETSLGIETFVRFFAERAEPDVSPEVYLDPARAYELYLACGCALGDTAALAAFEREYMSNIEGVLLRVEVGPELDDVLQQLRALLYLPGAGRPSKLSEFNGSGDLFRWLSVVAMRTALNALRTRRRAQRGEPVDEELLLRIPDLADDPELAHLKALYGAEIKLALREAMTSLSPESRVLLRQYHLDGRDLQALSSSYGLHVSNVSLRLSRARAELVAALRERLQQRLELEPSEVESVLRLVRSRLELSSGAWGHAL
jgi:RNA polymerase sigma-70 factor (ECF subfamily)